MKRNDQKPASKKRVTKHKTDETGDEYDEKVVVLSNDDIFTQSVLHYPVYMTITQVGSNLERNLKKYLVQMCEGKCIEEGYIKHKSIKIITYSSGVAYAEQIRFDVVFECKLCYPTEGMHLICFAKNITKAGIRAEIYENESLKESTPMMIFIARDHHYNNNNINDIEVGQKLNVRILGCRFELNDQYISVIAEYIS